MDRMKNARLQASAMRIKRLKKKSSVLKQKSNGGEVFPSPNSALKRGTREER
jgi:hypothetical protein